MPDRLFSPLSCFSPRKVVPELPLHEGTIPWKGYRVTLVATPSGDVEAVQSGRPPSLTLWQRFLYLLRSLFGRPGGSRWRLSERECGEAHALLAVLRRRRGLPAPAVSASPKPRPGSPVSCSGRFPGRMPGLQLVQLPVECLWRVVRRLGLHDLLRISRASRQMHGIFRRYSALLLLPALYWERGTLVKDEAHFRALLKTVSDAPIRDAEKVVALHAMAVSLARFPCNSAPALELLDVLVRLSPRALMKTRLAVPRAWSIAAAIAFALYRQGGVDFLHDAVLERLGRLSVEVRSQVALGYAEQLHVICMQTGDRETRVGMAPIAGLVPARIAQMLAAIERSSEPVSLAERVALLRQAIDSRWEARIITWLLEVWVHHIDDDEPLEHARAIWQAIAHWFRVDPPTSPLLQPWAARLELAIAVCLRLTLTGEPGQEALLVEPSSLPSPEAAAALQFAHVVVATRVAVSEDGPLLRHAEAMVQDLPPALREAGRCLQIVLAARDAATIRVAIRSCQRLQSRERYPVLQCILASVWNLPEDERVPAAAAVLHAFLALPPAERPCRYDAPALLEVMKSFLRAVPAWWWTPCNGEIADFLLATARSLVEAERRVMLAVIEESLYIVPEEARHDLRQRLLVMR